MQCCSDIIFDIGVNEEVKWLVDMCVMSGSTGIHPSGKGMSAGSEILVQMSDHRSCYRGVLCYPGPGYFCKDRVLGSDDHDHCRADARDGYAADYCGADSVRGGADDTDGGEGVILW